MFCVIRPCSHDGLKKNACWSAVEIQDDTLGFFTLYGDFTAVIDADQLHSMCLIHVLYTWCVFQYGNHVKLVTGCLFFSIAQISYLQVENSTPYCIVWTTAQVPLRYNGIRIPSKMNADFGAEYTQIPLQNLLEIRPCEQGLRVCLRSIFFPDWKMHVICGRNLSHTSDLNLKFHFVLMWILLWFEIHVEIKFVLQLN